MLSWPLHPALARLLQMKSRACLLSVGRCFSTPLRSARTVVAVLLVLVWCRNAVSGILLRDPFGPSTVHRWLPALMLAYTAWHFVKLAWKRPAEPIAWTDSEREFICGGPFSRREQLWYRIAILLRATLLKAVCTSLLLLPDLTLPALGFLGVFLALAFIDLSRITLEIMTAGLSRKQYFVFRSAAAGSVVLTTGACLAQAASLAQMSSGSATWTPDWIISGIAGCLVVLQSPAALTLQAPFVLFAKVVTACELTAGLVGWLLTALIMVAATAEGAVWLDAFLHRLSVKREILRGSACRSTGVSHERPASTLRLASVPHLRGVGPIAWRQFVCLRQHLGSVLVALLLPGALAVLPVLTSGDGFQSFLCVCGGVGFVSLLLLPAALKFDFRRDTDLLSVFRLIPTPPVGVVLGQLTVPVMTSLLFQVAVLCTAASLRSVPFGYVAASTLFLIPVNVLVFAVENLLFLMYPYSPEHDGLEVLLRTTLAFTAKICVCSATLAVLLGLLEAAAGISQLPIIRDVSGGHHQPVFLLTAWISIVAFAIGATRLLTFVYDSRDVYARPGLEA